MAKNSCVTRIVNSINKSSIKSVDKQELINKIKTAVADSKKTNLDKSKEYAVIPCFAYRSLSPSFYL